jgi:outer membrane lipoprotein carrier protein
MSIRISQFLCFFCLLSTALVAQTPKPPAPEQNDPAAKKVLDRIRTKYDGYKTFEAAFNLSVEVPGEAKEIQKGVVGQQGDKFRLEMGEQVIVNDTKTTWIYLKKNNEVQVNNSEPSSSEASFFTPKELLHRYQKGDFIYAITDKTTEGSKILTEIEFKPKDKKSDYSKIRVSIDEKNGSMEYIKAFGKDGSRYTFSITRFSPNKALPADYFMFDTKKYPGIRVEDLRM